MIRLVLACLALSACLSACGSSPTPTMKRPFVPKSDYGFPPKPSAYSEEGDCKGGSQLAAITLQEPAYPRGAFRNGLQGWVALRLDVDETGRPRNVQVVDSLPKGPFDDAARATVRSWRFEPPQSGGLTRCVVVLDYRLGVGRIGL